MREPPDIEMMTFNERYDANGPEAPAVVWRLPQTQIMVASIAVVLLTLAIHALAAPSLNQGILQLRNGQASRAVDTLKKVVQKPGADTAAARYWLGRAQFAGGKTAAATATLQEVIETKPSSGAAHYWLGMAHVRSGRIIRARDRFRTALDCRAEFTPARQALEDLDRRIKAISEGQMIPQLNPAVRGHRVAIDTGSVPLDIGTIDLRSYNVADYTFSDAPADWLARSGTWAITNRWTCQPQWSWMGGHAENRPAILYNRREFTGDVVVEAYMAFQMGLGKVHSYKNPMNLNITIHGDGANPSSGYSFMIGADNNHDTRIMKGSRILASTTDEDALLPIFEDGYPSSYEFHRKWWGIRARKHGNKLQLYLDNKLVLDTRDSSPLDKGHVGIWTHNNGIIVSRIKIYYSGEAHERTPAPGQGRIQTHPVELSEPWFDVTSPTHPSMYADFEPPIQVSESDTKSLMATELTKLAKLSRDGSDTAASPLRNDRPLLQIAERDQPVGGHCIRITNTVAGGTFMVPIHKGKLDISKFHRLGFDYRLPADDSVKVNLYVTAGAEQYEIGFCGPHTETPRARYLAEIRNVRADGKWHHAEFDLVGALKNHGINLKKRNVKNLRIGNLHDENYLWAGFGGNGYAATYYLDNIALEAAGGANAKLAVHPVSDRDIDGYSISVDDSPHTKPAARVSVSEQSKKLKLDGSGIKYAHVRAKSAKGEWSPSRHYLLHSDIEAPVVSHPKPASGGALSDRPIQIRLREPGGSGINADSISLSVNGKKLDVGHRAVRYHPQWPSICVDATMVLDGASDGTDVNFVVRKLSDRAGNEMSEPREYAYHIDFDRDSTPPNPPQLYAGVRDELIFESFENSVGSFTTYGGSQGAKLSIDRSTAASGTGSLRVYNPVEGGRYGIIRRDNFDAGKYRIVSFDYRVPSRLRADIAVYVNGDMKGIKFKDTDSNIGVIGSVPDVVDDNQWHHAEFNLYQMLRKDDPTASSYIVRQLVIADWNWKANVEGQVYHIDNFRIMPVRSGAEGLKLSCTNRDITGIDGISYKLQRTPTRNLKKGHTIDGRTGMTGPIDSINGWLSARIRDGAGNFSQLYQQRLAIDSEPPNANFITPADDEKSADPTVSMRLSDDGTAGVDPASLVLDINGKQYRLGQKKPGGISYTSENGHLVWDCEKVKPRPIVFPDGKQVNIRLSAAADFAGNKMSTPPGRSWTMDYSLDRTGPQIDSIKSKTHRTFLTCTFEEGPDGWRSRGGNKGAKVELDKSTAAGGEGSVRLTQKKDGGNMGAYVTSRPYSVERYPILSFDYRIPSDVSIDLVAHKSDGKNVAVALTDNSTGAVARAKSIRADNKWHHVSVNLGKIVRKMKKHGSLRIEHLYLCDRNKLTNDAGANAWFDNFVIGAVGAEKPVLRWTAADPTGIDGYSYAFDRSSSTVPDEKPEGGSRRWKAENNIEKGRWYFHLRAVDGAGNFGPTTHYALMHRSD